MNVIYEDDAVIVSEENGKINIKAKPRKTEPDHPARPGCEIDVLPWKGRLEISTVSGSWSTDSAFIVS